MSPQERNARAYCLSIGANPDEIVWGYFGRRVKTHDKRWRFYVGAKIQQQHAAE